MLLLASVAAGAQESVGGVQSLSAIRRDAVAAVAREVGAGIAGVTFEAADLDPRLRLTACPTPLTARAAAPRGTQSRLLVRVSCTAGAFWNLNVPVEIHRRSEVLVMRRAVARGAAITAADVQVESRVLPGLASPYVSQVADLAGRLTRRAIPAGVVLTADALDAAYIIYRGQSVTLAATAGGLEVRASGVALANAATSQRVRVRNLLSLKVVEGVAESAGVVRVNP